MADEGIAVDQAHEHSSGPGRGQIELERRIAAADRLFSPAERGRLLLIAQDAIAAEMSSDMQLADDFTRAEAEHRRWQSIHRYVRAIPYRDDPAETRPRQWQMVLEHARKLGDLDVMEWAVNQIDRAYAEASRHPGGVPEGAGTQQACEPVYLVFLKAIANKKRKAKAALQWAQTARQNGWITCTTATLGENLIALHAASVHSRDNPDYDGPVDAAHLKE